ncbi:MAG: WecB/TagA/CpsF family glycosyltransferase [Bacillus subtilis]|nr:WecB/TagA/CpsF family glycosyltransferase [Bacillus subtilis]
MNKLQKTNNKRACILGYPVDLIDKESALERVLESIKTKAEMQITTLNPEMIMQSEKNPNLKAAVKGADLIIPDGIGIILALKKLGIKTEQIPGIEFSYNLIEKCVENNFKLAFLGASKEVIDNMTDKFKSKYPDINIVFAHDGYFNEKEQDLIIDKLKEAQPNVLFVALGVPKQEIWIARHKELMPDIIMLGVGGSFDVWANKVKRAPSAYRKLGLEWFYRLIKEPSRFNRMFPTLPLFLIKSLIDNKNTRKEY